MGRGAEDSSRYHGPDGVQLKESVHVASFILRSRVYSNDDSTDPPQRRQRQ